MAAALSRKTCIVTGASKGLGRALSIGLVEAGARVAMLARSRAELEALAAELGDAAQPFPCDIRDAGAIRSTIAAVVSRFGGVDILINNAMMNLLNPIDGISEEAARCETETNLLAPILLTREVVPHMLAAGAGHIVNVTSESVAMPFPYSSVYVATKAGLEGLSAALRVELAPKNIRVGVFRPGFMGESASAALWSDENKAGFYQALKDTGLDHYAGQPVSPHVQAAALISMLTMPPEANVDHMTVRSAR